MDDGVANVTGLVAALAAVVGAVATYIQARLAWRQSREGAGPQALTDRYRLIRGWALGGSALALVAVEVAILQGLPRWALMIAVCVVAVVLVALGTAIGYSTAVRVSPASIPIDAQHLEGHWFGTFGNAYFRVQGSRVEAIYDHEDGRILGTIYDGVFDGWWNELPTRQPPDNAGLVNFRMRREGGKLRLDGEWLYGREGNWMVWELTEVDRSIPVSVQAKFEDSSTFTMG
jgi:hypothetical protein